MKLFVFQGNPLRAWLLVAALGVASFATSACGKADAGGGAVAEPSDQSEPATMKQITLAITGMT